MKAILIILVAFGCCFCNQSKHSTINRNYEVPKLNYAFIYYQVLDIDSIKNAYIISAIKNDTIYKILSYIDNSKSVAGERISVNGIYNFKLSPLLRYWNQKGLIQNNDTNDYSKLNSKDSTIVYDKLQIILEKGCMGNLYTARQLVGLYYN